MTRVIAGEWRGRRLLVPQRGVRPTAERVREAIVNSLTARLGDWSGLRVVDLYAGSGALGIEALSRGAAQCVFVEKNPAAAAVIRRNLAALAAESRAQVLVRDARSVASKHLGPFDVAFADPPYQDADSVSEVLGRCCDARWFAPGAELVVETGRRSRQPWDHPGLVGVDRREYGDTTVWYGHCVGTAASSRSTFALE